MPKRLLVLGASTLRAAAFATWHRMGLEIVLADGFSSARYDDLADEVWAYDPRDGSADLEAITALAATCDGVTTLADDSQATAAAVAEALGRPGLGAEVGAVSRSKARQRELCQRAGLPTPVWRMVNDPGDLRAFYSGVCGKAVLKPVDATGGAGVMLVHDRDDAMRQWPLVRRLSASRKAVIEQFVPGPEVCVEAIVVGGRPIFVSVTGADHLNGPGFVCVMGRYSRYQPDREAATVAAGRLAAALGVVDGLMHAEFKITGDGWVVLETALRPGGGLTAELTRRVTGVDFYEVQALLALGDAAAIEPVLRRAADADQPAYAQVFYLVATGQVLRFVPPAHVVLKFDNVRLVHQQVGPGQRVREPISDGGRAGYVLGWGDDPDRVDFEVCAAGKMFCDEMGLTLLAGPSVGSGRAAA